MKNKQISIKKICEINSSAISKKGLDSEILYLDTGSITRNKISNIQRLDPLTQKIPSRAQRKVKDKTIVYSVVRPILEHHGYLDNPPKNLLVSTGFSTLNVTDDSVDPKFLYYCLTQKNITNFLHGIAVNNASSYPALSPEDLGNLTFSIPEDLTCQVEIADAISLLDRKIEIAEEIVAELDMASKLIHDYWFSQYEFPDENGNPYKSSGGKMTWDDNLNKEIPFGWNVSSIADLIANEKNGDWGEDSIVGNYQLKVNCIRGTDINGLNGLEECDPPIRYILTKNKMKVLSDGDVIIEISGGSPTQSTGRVSFITNQTLVRFDNPLICSNFCKVISLKNRLLLLPFVFNWKNLYENEVFFNFEGKTSGIKNLLFETASKSFFMAIPDDRLLELFSNLVAEFEFKKQKCLEEVKATRILRDWLTPLLINGQVKINNFS